MKDVIENDFMEQKSRTVLENAALLNQYMQEVYNDWDKQIPLRQAMFNFYNDEGFVHPVYREAASRDNNSHKTFVYKFGINRYSFVISKVKTINSMLSKGSRHQSVSG